MDICSNLMRINAEISNYNISYYENSFLISNIDVSGCYKFGFIFAFISGMFAFCLSIWLYFKNIDIEKK